MGTWFPQQHLVASLPVTRVGEQTGNVRVRCGTYIIKRSYNGTENRKTRSGGSQPGLRSSCAMVIRNSPPVMKSCRSIVIPPKRHSSLALVKGSVRPLLLLFPRRSGMARAAVTSALLRYQRQKPRRVSTHTTSKQATPKTFVRAALLQLRPANCVRRPLVLVRTLLVVCSTLGCQQVHQSDYPRSRDLARFDPSWRLQKWAPLLCLSRRYKLPVFRG